jgi:phenylacetate-CoA ligase
MAEIVTAAGECEHGRLHLWPEVGAVEILNGTETVPTGSSGDLVATGLINVDMPLIRYRTGDRTALAPEIACPCGRHLPQLLQMEGRVDDVLYTPDGRAAGRLDPVFKAELAIREAQIVQESLDLVRVSVVPAIGFGVADRIAITKGLQDRLPGVRILVELVDAIPRTSNGKLRAVVSRLPAAERSPASQ